MTNREKYKDELIEACKNNVFYDFYDHNIKPFYDVKAWAVTPTCDAQVLTMLWLDEEYVEPEPEVDWSKEHSKKTRQSEFLKMFPNARIDDNGTLLICPRHVDVTAIDSRRCLGSPTCTECLKEYWLSEDSEEDN